LDLKKIQNEDMIILFDVLNKKRNINLDDLDMSISKIFKRVTLDTKELILKSIEEYNKDIAYILKNNEKAEENNEIKIVKPLNKSYPEKSKSRKIKF